MKSYFSFPAAVHKKFDLFCSIILIFGKYLHVITSFLITTYHNEFTILMLATLEEFLFEITPFVSQPDFEG